MPSCPWQEGGACQAGPGGALWARQAWAQGLGTFLLSEHVGRGFPEASRRPGQWPAGEPQHFLLGGRSPGETEKGNMSTTTMLARPPLPGILTRQGPALGVLSPGVSSPGPAGALSLPSLVLLSTMPASRPAVLGRQGPCPGLSPSMGGHGGSGTPGLFQEADGQGRVGSGPDGCGTSSSHVACGVGYRCGPPCRGGEK